MKQHTRYSIAIALALSSAGIVSAATSAPDQTSSAQAAVPAGRYSVEPGHTRIQFSVSHLGFTDWYGDLTGASGSLALDPRNLSASTLDISIPTDSVSTTNAKLDGELRSADWFDAARYPTIRFVSTRVTRTGPRTAKIIGDLSFHGVTKPVTLDATLNGAGTNPIEKTYTVGFNGTTTIRRSDFGVKTYLPMIGDETTLRISAAFVPAAS